MESELQALSCGAREAVYLSNFLMELGFNTFFSVPINSASTGALRVAGNAKFSSTTKHIALRFFSLGELIKRNKIILHHNDDLIVPRLKYRLLNYVNLTTQGKVLTSGGALLNGMAEGILQGLVTEHHEEQHLARIATLIVSGIGRKFFSVKSATKRDVVSISDFDNPRLELSGITVSRRAENDDLHSLVFDLSVDSHRGKGLAMNAMISAQMWHRRRGHLNKRSLELMQRFDGNGVAFGGSTDHCDVCTVGNIHQLAHPRKAKHADITAPFQLVYGD